MNRDGAPVVAGDVVVRHGRSVDVSDPEQRRYAWLRTHETPEIHVELVDVGRSRVAFDDRSVCVTATCI